MYGSSHRRSLVAVVVPRREELLRMLGRAGQVAISPPHPLPQQLPTAASAVVSGGSGTGGGVTGTHGAAAAGETVQEGRGEALEGDGKGGSGGKGEGALEEARRVAQVSAVPQPVAGGDAEARRAAGDLAAEPAGAVEGGGGGPAGAGAGGMGAEGDKASTLVSSLCAVPQVVQQVLKALQVGGGTCDTCCSAALLVGGATGAQLLHLAAQSVRGQRLGFMPVTWMGMGRKDALPRSRPVAARYCTEALRSTPRHATPQHSTVPAPVQSPCHLLSSVPLPTVVMNAHRRRWAAPTASRASSWCVPCTWFRSPSAPTTACSRPRSSCGGRR